MSKTTTVEITGFAYEPREVTIRVGECVKWYNRDAAMHTATREEDPEFDTGLLPQGKESEEIQFTEVSGPEGFGYKCTPHPFMQGVVIVLDEQKDQTTGKC